MATSMNPSALVDSIAIIEHGFEGPPGKTGEPSSSVSGLIFVSNVEALDGKYIGEKFYKSKTIPSNLVIDSITLNSTFIRVHVEVAAGFDSFTPKAYVEDVEITNLVESSTRRYFTGYADIHLLDDQDKVTVKLDNGQSSFITLVRRSDLGPVISDSFFGSYPGDQVELKDGDQVEVHCIVSSDAGYVDVLTSPGVTGVRLTLGEANSGGAPDKLRASGFINVTNLNGKFPVLFRAFTDSGVPGEIFESDSELTINQTTPKIDSLTITYPSNHQAGQSGDEILINLVSSDWDKIIYSSNGLSFDQPKVYVNPKPAIILRDSATDLTITLLKDSNGTYLRRTIPVQIASPDLSAVISIKNADNGIEKSDTYKPYTISLKANQPLLALPIITFNVPFSNNWTYNSVDDTYTSKLSVDISETAPSLEIFDAKIINLISINSSNVRFDRNYPFYSRSAGSKYYLSPNSNVIELGSIINSSFSIKLFEEVELICYDSNEGQTFGYVIVDDLGQPSESGSKIIITDQTMVTANLSGLLCVSISNQEGS